MTRNGLRLLSIALLAPLLANGAEDWRESPARATNDMPAAGHLRDKGIIDSYIDEITTNFVGETDEDKSGNVFRFAFNRLRWLSACSLLYSKRTQTDDSWTVRENMILLQRHLSLFAAATVATIDPTLTTDELVEMMMKRAADSEGPRFDQWLNSPDEPEDSDYKLVDETCAENLRRVMQLEQ